MAYDIEAFSPLEEYEEWASRFVRALRECPPAPGHERVFYPGLHADELRREREANGIEYHPEVLSWFQDTAASLDAPTAGGSPPRGSHLGSELVAAVEALVPGGLSHTLRSIATPEARAQWEARTSGGKIGMGSMSHGGGIASQPSVDVSRLAGAPKRRGLSTSSTTPTMASRRRPARWPPATVRPHSTTPSSAAGPLAALLASQPTVVVDGGLGSMLPPEQVAGMWSAGHLATDEGCRAIREAHLEFARAGAEVISTNSYKVSARLLRNLRDARTATASEAGGAGPREEEEEAEELLRRSVRLACEAVEQHASETAAPRPLIAATLGPFSISTPFLSRVGTAVDTAPASVGESESFEEMVEFHRAKGATLLAAGADVLAFETIASVAEAAAVAEALRRLPASTEAWVAFTCSDAVTTGR